MNKIKRRYAARLLTLLLVIALAGGAAAGCANDNGSEGNVASGGNEEPAVQSEAAKLLDGAAEASAELERFEIRMHLEQSLDHEGAKENVKVDASGTVEREPLQMQQTVVSNYDGDVSEIRTILTPDNYYINDTLIGVWNRLPQSEIDGVRSALSDFQTDPGALLSSLRDYADGFDVAEADGEGGKVTVLTLTEEDEGAKELMADILASTLGAAAMDSDVRDSIKLSKLVYKATLDGTGTRLLRLDAVSDMDIAFEEGVATKVTQTLNVKYGEFDTAQPVVVPEEAQDAPEIIEPGMEDPDMMEDPGVEDPGVEDPGMEDPGVEDSGVEDPGTAEPAL